MIAKSWNLKPQTARAGVVALEAAQQKGCGPNECWINFWAASLREDGMPEREADLEIRRIFAGSGLRSIFEVRKAIQKLRDLEVWPW